MRDVVQRTAGVVFGCVEADLADDPNDNPSLPERRFEPASKGDSWTIAIALEGCQTGNCGDRFSPKKFIVPLQFGGIGANTLVTVTGVGGHFCQPALPFWRCRK